jgi:hypothetical protein
MQPLLARLEALEKAPAADSRVLSRLEALEAAEGHDPRLWEKLIRLEAELDAWKHRMALAGTQAAPLAEAETERGAPMVQEVEQFADAVPTAESAPRPSELATPSPTADQSPAVLLSDAVDDWLEMPPVLVNPEDFRRELSLFSSYTAAPDPEPETPEPEVEPEVVEVEALEIVETLGVAPAVVEEAAKTMEPRLSAPPQEPPPPVRAATPVSGLDIKEFWRSLMLSIRERDKRLHAVLTDAKLTAVEAERFEIALPTGFEWHRDKLQEGRKLLETVATELAGGRLLTMECTLGGEKATPPKDSEHDDLVARATGVFGGASIVE